MLPVNKVVFSELSNERQLSFVWAGELTFMENSRFILNWIELSSEFASIGLNVLSFLLHF